MTRSGGGRCSRHSRNRGTTPDHYSPSRTTASERLAPSRTRALPQEPSPDAQKDDPNIIDLSKTHDSISEAIRTLLNMKKHISVQDETISNLVKEKQDCEKYCSDLKRTSTMMNDDAAKKIENLEYERDCLANRLKQEKDNTTKAETELQEQKDMNLEQSRRSQFECDKVWKLYNDTKAEHFRKYETLKTASSKLEKDLITSESKRSIAENKVNDLEMKLTDANERASTLNLKNQTLKSILTKAIAEINDQDHHNELDEQGQTMLTDPSVTLTQPDDPPPRQTLIDIENSIVDISDCTGTGTTHEATNTDTNTDANIPTDSDASSTITVVLTDLQSTPPSPPLLPTPATTPPSATTTPLRKTKRSRDEPAEPGQDEDDVIKPNSISRGRPSRKKARLIEIEVEDENVDGSN